MKRIFPIIVAIFWFQFHSLCQVQLTQYFLDGTYYNPAFAGADGSIGADIFGRYQWMGFSEANGNKVAPVSLLFNVGAPLNAIRSGIGLNIVYDKLGYETTAGGKFNYNYRLKFKDENKSMGFGLGFSLVSKTIDFTKLVLEEGNDPLVIGQQKETGLIPDFDVGLLYQQMKRWYLGISVINLIQSTSEIGNLKYGRQRTLYGTGGFCFNLRAKQTKPLYLIPSVLVKSNLEHVQFDINARLEYNNLFWAGLSYRYEDAVAAMAGINLKGFMVGVSYDFTTSFLSEATPGSLEIFMGYRKAIAPRLKSKSLYNTRYL